MDSGYLVAAGAVVLAVVFSLSLDGFLTGENMLVIGRNSAVLGILALGMTVVVIGRGLDLSIVVTWGFTAAITATFINSGHSTIVGLLVGLGVAMLFGLINGLIVAYVDIPPLFVTLATSSLFVGASRLLYVHERSSNLESAQLIVTVSRARPLGVPAPLLIFIVLAVLVHLLMGFTAIGRSIYAHGDKPAAAVLTGLPVRPVIVFTYLVSAFLAYIAGLISVGVAGIYDINVVTAGTRLYDVFAVVVVGGVSLAGGRGTVGGILAGMLFIGIMANGLVLLNFDNIRQNGLKALIILIALAIDSAVHPPDEEISRPGEL